MRPPIDHTFTVNGTTYRLVESDSGGDIRIQTEYAIALAPAPDSIRAQLGAVLYARAVARECLKDAPPDFDIDHVSLDEWGPFLEGVFAFIGKRFPVLQPEPERSPEPVPERPAPVAPAQIVSPAFAGRAG